MLQNSKSLMSPRRLDLGFKLFYLNNKDKLSELSNNLYDDPENEKLKLGSINSESNPVLEL